MSRVLLIILAAILSVTVLAAAGLGVYNNFFKEDQNEGSNNEQTENPGNEEQKPVETDNNVPVASVTYCEQYVNADIAWGSYGDWAPAPGLDNKLAAAFQFVAPHTAESVEGSIYKDWYCDFYVKLDCDLGVNQLFLGGNYGEFGWVGFHNGETTVSANEEIALLGSVAKKPWTYGQVAENVGTFVCGVGDVMNTLDGATFTVSLRLTNPADESETIDVSVVTYTFGGEYTIVNYTPAN